MRITTIISICLLFLTSCTRTEDSASKLSPDDYEIYSLLINEFYPPIPGDSIRTIGIFSPTIPGRWINSNKLVVARIVGGNWITIDSTANNADSTLAHLSTSINFRSAESSFVGNTYKKVDLDSSAFHLRSKYSLIKVNEKRTIVSAIDSTIRGIVGLSRIGFNSTRTEAIVFINEGRDEGLSIDFLLRRINSHWEIVNGVCQ